ncbi:kinase, putative [Ricinus communis]|uniref:non-specific serine/threonine protein kinase n=1 Tax=Ricinus communis TaxID=3988 RepID=B9RX67_RICCO|nr:kinase, putative [Ricinus communis]|eukprot:XP_002518336.1 L-type lectin-domain containing receptor kinase IX.1 [Ricinus communis]
MAFSKFNKTRSHSPVQLPLLMVAVVILFICFKVPSVTSLSFDFPSFNQNDRNIRYAGNASVTSQEISLTTNQREKDMSASMGRIIYASPLYLWDKESKNLTNFFTNFSFTIDSLNSTNYGDGMAFFLAPTDFPFPDMAGGGFGLSKDNETSAYPFVAVEFDTYGNKGWDPPFDSGNGEHVGIDINLTVSKNHTKWYTDIEDGRRNDASISYDSSSKVLSVTFTSFNSSSNEMFEQNLSYQVDLRDCLPEWVAIGFSATTVASFEMHTLHSRYFTSDLQFIDKPIPPTVSAPMIEEVPPTKRSKKEVGLVVGLSVSGFVIFISLICLFMWKRSRGETNVDDEEVVDHFDMSMDEDFEKGTGPRKFSYNDLVRATNNFSEQEKLGEGGFGAVYKGFLREFMNSYVAVKRISKGSKQGMKEYASEVKIISRLRHRNLVQLIGWCHEEKKLLLVYEFMPNGSLDSHLFKQDSLLTWDIRYKIAQGLASGLLYLQEEWEQCVLHRDIKSSNIMLDSNFNAKLGDFGLARLVDHGKGPETTILAGTMGYMAPECAITGKASRESDVYSFGVVALEIACGRKPINYKAGEDQVYLIQWVWNLYGGGPSKLLEAADPRLNGDFDEQQMKCLIIVGLWCVHPDEKCRASIRQAIQVLKFEAPLPILPAKMPVPTYSPPPQPPSSVSLSWEATGSQNQSSSCSYTTNSSISTVSSSGSSTSALLMHTR